MRDGILNVHKPAGWTSHDVVAKLRLVLACGKGTRIGHAGTLDPAATGVLPILVGKATRIAEFLLEWDKEYRAVLRLGETTDTQDATGTVLRRCEIGGLTEAEIREAVARFRGAITQVPPMYSAVKVEGRPLYKAARAGQTVARDPRPVTVHALDVVGVSGRDVELRVVCSKGTYVRTLCEDIGQVLGVGGHLLSLERRRVGPLRVEQALTLDQVQAAVEAGSVEGHLLTLDEALTAFPVLALDDFASARVLRGAPVPWRPGCATDPAFPNGLAPGQPVRLKDLRGRFLALGRLADDGGAGQSGEERRVAVLKVFVDA